MKLLGQTGRLLTEQAAGSIHKVKRRHADTVLTHVTILSGLYWRYSARLQKSWRRALNRVGKLKPSFVLWIVTYQCNFHCAFCEAGAGEPASDELTTLEGETLLEDMRRMGVRRVLISGGEPAMRPDLPYLLDCAQRLSISPGLISNGSLVETLWPDLRRFGCYLYVTSVDGPAAEHDRVRDQGSFEKALRALDRVATIGVPTRVVNTVVYPGNLPQLPELAEWLEASSATHWLLSPVFAIGRAAGEPKFQLSGEELKKLVAFVQSRRGRGGPRVDLAESCRYLNRLAACYRGRPFFCGAGLTHCAVMPNGDVLPCGQVYDAVSPAGNVRDTPLSRIWKERFTPFRTNYQPAGCQGCHHWNSCQGGCWAQRQIDGRCLKDVWVRAPGTRS